MDALVRGVAEARLDAAVGEVRRDRHVFALVQGAGQPFQAGEDAAEARCRRALRRDVEVRGAEVVQLRHLREWKGLLCGHVFLHRQLDARGLKVWRFWMATPPTMPLGPEAGGAVLSPPHRSRVAWRPVRVLISGAFGFLDFSRLLP